MRNSSTNLPYKVNMLCSSFFKLFKNDCLDVLVGRYVFCDRKFLSAARPIYLADNFIKLYWVWEEVFNNRDVICDPFCDWWGGGEYGGNGQKHVGRGVLTLRHWGCSDLTISRMLNSISPAVFISCAQRNSTVPNAVSFYLSSYMPFWVKCLQMRHDLPVTGLVEFGLQERVGEGEEWEKIIWKHFSNGIESFDISRIFTSNFEIFFLLKFCKWKWITKCLFVDVHCWDGRLSRLKFGFTYILSDQTPI